MQAGVRSRTRPIMASPAWPGPKLLAHPSCKRSTRPALLACVVALVLAPPACKSPPRRSQSCLEERRAITELVQRGAAEEVTPRIEAYAAQCQSDSTYDIDRWQRSLERQRRHHQQLEQQRAPAQGDTTHRALTEFLAWAASLREAHDKHLGETVCEPPTSDAFGLCTSRVQAADSVRWLRHWKLDPSVFKFETSLTGPLHCQHLGPHRQVARWTAEIVTRELCEPLEHGLKGTQVLFENYAERSVVHVFSKSYPSKDAAFRQRLQR